MLFLASRTAASAVLRSPALSAFWSMSKVLACNRLTSISSSSAWAMRSAS
jgi:hypothetical protein